MPIEPLDLGIAGLRCWSLAVHAVFAGPESLLAVVSPEERARAARLRFPRDQQRFLAARLLVRCGLSQIRPVAAADWRFTVTAAGRPEIAPGLCAAPPQFSLSHSGDHAILAVTDAGELGIDIEDPVLRRRSILLLARETCAPAELAVITAEPESRQCRAFLWHWTLKEAYAKARGLGLRLPLAEISFLPGPEGGITAAFGPGLGDQTTGWQFRSFTLSQGVMGALAVRFSS